MRQCVQLLTVLLVLGLAASASATPIVAWDTPVTISSSTDVSTLGTQVFGRNLINTGAAAIVNGADFSYTTAWGLTYSENGYGQTTSSAPVMAGPDATNYRGILSQFRYATGATFTVNVGNLALNKDYLVQIWEGDWRAFPNDRTETIKASASDTNIPTLKFLDSDSTYVTAGSSSETAAAAHGQYVIGRFHVDSTTGAAITFTFTPGLAGSGTAFNAMQIRAIPEPSSLVLLVMGVMGLLAYAWKKRK